MVAMVPGHIFRLEQNAMDAVHQHSIQCGMSGDGWTDLPISLSLSLSLSACLSVQELNLDCGAEAQVSVTFDPSYCSDKLSRREEKQLSITFREHAHRVRGVLCGTGQPAHITAGVKC